MVITPRLWHLPVAAFFLTVLPQCNEAEPDDVSRAQDIFREDENGSRRKQASQDERLWTISMNGCTGHLISPEHMMTAAHCSPRSGARYTSGAAMNAGRTSDILVESVVEQSAQLDYAILKIRWNGQRPTNQKFPRLIATSSRDLAVGRSNGQGDEIFTVGFPGDKVRSWGATYSEGRAKEVRGSLLRYNMGIINGNSGGGVWRKSDGMLVSLTNGGPSILGQPGWNNRDTSDSTAWNHGAAMWNIYAQSRTLQDIFPGGKNRFAESNESERVFVALGASARGSADTYTVMLSVPEGVDQVIHCEASGGCNDNSRGVATASYVRTHNGRRIYKSTAPLPLGPRLRMSFVARSGSRQIALATVEFQNR